MAFAASWASFRPADLSRLLSFMHPVTVATPHSKYVVHSVRELCLGVLFGCSTRRACALVSLTGDRWAMGDGPWALGHVWRVAGGGRWVAGGGWCGGGRWVVGGGRCAVCVG